MNAEQCADAMCAYLGSRLRLAIGAVADEVKEEVRGRINVSVGRDGSRIIRSKPGEPPRRETGDYRDSWVSEVTEGGSTITGTAGTTSNIGPMLEFGTERMAARPHVAPVVDQLRGNLVPRIQEKL
jgi:hypothetical protein